MTLDQWNNLIKSRNWSIVFDNNIFYLYHGTKLVKKLSALDDEIIMSYLLWIEHELGFEKGQQSEKERLAIFLGLK